MSKDEELLYIYMNLKITLSSSFPDNWLGSIDCDSLDEKIH
jgi:hypothetical protein